MGEASGQQPGKKASYRFIWLAYAAAVFLFGGEIVTAISEGLQVPEGIDAWRRAELVVCAVNIRLISTTGYAIFFLIFFATPILITLYKRDWAKTVVLFVLVWMFAEIRGEYDYIHAAFMFLVAVCPIAAWLSLAKTRLQKRLMLWTLSCIALLYATSSLLFVIGKGCPGETMF